MQRGRCPSKTHAGAVFATLLFAFASALPSSVAAQNTPAPTALPQLPPITPIVRPYSKGEFPLYPGRAVNGSDEQWESYLGGPIVRNVVSPTLTPLLPSPGKANGTAMIYAPGGGFMYLGMNDPEIHQLVENGITVFILKYRTNPTDRNPRSFLTNMYRFLFGIAAQNRSATSKEAKPLHAPAEALEDGLTAVRLIRSRAKEWNIDPKRIGFMGGSAGAMTAIDVSFTADAAARPDFVVTMIGPKKVDQVPVTAPPLFAVASNDDPLFPGTTENLVAAWSKAGRPVEAHMFQKGGHGLANGTTGQPWFGLLVRWLQMHGLLQGTTP